MTWIVFRVVKDRRCMAGVRWEAIGWVNNETEGLALSEAYKFFGRHDQEKLRLVKTEKGCGFLM